MKENNYTDRYDTDRLSQEKGNYYSNTQSKAIINYYTDGSSARQLQEPVIIPESQDDFGERPAEQPGFSFTNKLLILISTSLVIGLLITNLFFQFQTHQLNQTIEEIQYNTQQLSYESDLMLNEIARNYDYEKIKEVAESNDMQQNRNRVKDISNE